ncbi:hypothetical protein AAFF_G00221030 [Aldrovandia affinis]|uniref:Uncharacterized protein n=1 Tax=Aldrovandia affinis TaxID=143900 RepID=A0AAD7RFZ6_9TELE|nr:hypothetical protein AAFF_G00221030 [Aldrovandia affinis]
MRGSSQEKVYLISRHGSDRPDQTRRRGEGRGRGLSRQGDPFDGAPGISLGLVSTAITRPVRPPRAKRAKSGAGDEAPLEECRPRDMGDEISGVGVGVGGGRSASPPSQRAVVCRCGDAGLVSDRRDEG